METLENENHDMHLLGSLQLFALWRRRVDNWLHVY